MPIVRQLSIENVNTYCQEAISPHKNKSLNEYLKFCRDIDGHHIMRQVIALVVRGTMGNSGISPKTYFKCSQTSHFKRDCRKSLVSSHKVLGLCPRCKKGSRWANKCKSKADAQGNPLPWCWGMGSMVHFGSPHRQVYRAMDTPVTQPIQFVLQRNSFMFRTLSEGPDTLDLCASAQAVLTPQIGPQAISSRIYRPISSGSIGLLVGHSNALLKIIRVIPGVIDEYTPGEIKDMVEALNGVTFILQGSCIVQLVLMPKVQTNNPSLNPVREGFGSTRKSLACWVSILEFCLC